MENIIKKAATVIVLLLCLMFVFRCCMVADKSEFDTVYPTEGVKGAYSDGESVMYTLKMAREISDDGYFTAYALFVNKEAGEVQLTVRWNKSVYEYTDMEAGHEFSFVLLNETTGEKFPMKAIDSKQKSLYSFRKLRAEGVNFSDTDQLVAVMELRDGHESRQIVKFAEQPLKEYKLKGSEKKLLLDK